ncbi:hypothetical protein [Agromyces indicus]|uniref:Uncharacterized protein n=1 Tax=Agromyces indicus TaxID=758919 RepID=A0ABU1FIH0_9MICO|nr:hypothetical protein [Agromyces indicus]MDR5691132.1 hypothetical protein [Agromyces indicus]
MYTTFAALISPMLPMLYDPTSWVRSAFHTIGRLLAANAIAAIIPASTGASMPSTLWSGRHRRVRERTQIRVVIPRT